MLGWNPPPYAILSHRWGSEELNFQDVYSKRVIHRSQGYRKLLGACRIAAKYRVDYLWIDTCCIDKKSSAELSEAINSMYSWYEKAEVCLAYLEDVEHDTNIDDSFTKSVWFTRSWTLQELLAPRQVDFYNVKWKRMGHRGSKAALIQSRTGIPRDVLSKKAKLWEYSIVERMSWVSDRQATRPEDIAYSLLGIFDVNMPLLYGEGEKAFLRLQEEIVRRANEPSFLFWGSGSKAPNLFASSPVDFRDSRQRNMSQARTHTSFSLNNLGLNIEANLVRYDMELYAIVVGTTKHKHSQEMNCVVLLKELPHLHAFYRVGLAEVSPTARSKTKNIMILRGTPEQQLADKIEEHYLLSRIPYSIRIRFDLTNPILPVEHIPPSMGLETNGRWLHGTTQRDLRCTFSNATLPGIAKMACRVTKSKTLWFEVSFDFESRPCLLIRSSPGRVQSYRQSVLPSVYKLSEVIIDDAKLIRLEGSRAEVKVSEVIDEVSGPVSYFFRCTRLNHFAQIPVELTSLESPVWIRFIAPWATENRSEAWILYFSSTRPLRSINSRLDSVPAEVTKSIPYVALD